MFHGGVKYSMEVINDHGGCQMLHEGVRCSTEVSNIPRRVPNCSTEGLKTPRRVPNVPWRCQMFHARCKMFHRGAKCSTEGVKCSTEVSNIPRTVSNDSWRC